jgi:hypothetical protein
MSNLAPRSRFYFAAYYFYGFLHPEAVGGA